MLKRVFIAINLPQEVKNNLSQLQKNWPTLPARWLKRETFHITLAFLGNRNEQELEKIFEAVKKAGETHNSFSISLNKICYGPPHQNPAREQAPCGAGKFGAGQAPKIMPPRLVWAEGQTPDELKELKKGLDKLLAEKIGFVPEKREITSHITLARIKKWDWQRIEPNERPDVNLNISLEIPVNSIEVMESNLKRSGAEYETLLSVKLTEEKSEARNPKSETSTNDP